MIGLSDFAKLLRDKDASGSNPREWLESEGISWADTRKFGEISALRALEIIGEHPEQAMECLTAMFTSGFEVGYRVAQSRQNGADS